jgi:predicted dehydrogenase
MADIIRVGIAGAGWPGKAHARGYLTSGGYKLIAVADLIPSRRKEVMEQFRVGREYATWEELIADPEIDAVSLCLPTHLHADAAVAALRKGKHVVCERPPAVTAAQARRIANAAEKNHRQVLFAFQRRFGGPEMATKQAIAKGYAGNVYHARAVWTRTRAVPIGTGWFTDREKSGGGALMDLGSAMLDLGWHLLGEPKPTSVFAVTHQRLGGLVPQGHKFDVEEAATALVRFENGASLELTASWALNQSPAQSGVVCRLHGNEGAVDVYTSKGAVLHRSFDATTGKSKETPLKLPRLTGHGAMLRHFRECVLGKATPSPGPAPAVILMQMLEAMYKSAQTGKSVPI